MACLSIDADTRGVHTDGKTDRAKGKIKQAIGELTDDEQLKREGKIDEAAGSAKDAIDKAKDKLTGK